MANLISARAILLLTLLANLYGSLLYGDVLILKSGKVIDGDILQQSTSGVLIKLSYGTFTYPMSLVKNVTKEPPTTPSINQDLLPEWGVALARLATNEWASEIKQIPATVIDTGILKNVPYVSFHCASGGYEMNIYGDLDNPAGIEIGVQKYLLNNSRAKSNCLAFISSVIGGGKNESIIRRLQLDEKSTVTNGTLTVETSLPNEPDAYDAWWVSVYDKSLLEKARGSTEEILGITQPYIPPPRQILAQTPAIRTPVAPAANWSPDDFRSSRAPAVSSSPSSGRVYWSFTNRSRKVVTTKSTNAES